MAELYPADFGEGYSPVSTSPGIATLGQDLEFPKFGLWAHGAASAGRCHKLPSLHDTAWRPELWEGKAVALAEREVEVEGPLGKMMKLLRAMQPAFAEYCAFLEANGHSDPVV